MKATTKSVRIRKTQYQALKRISKATGWSITFLISTAINTYLTVVSKNATNEGAEHE